MKRGVVLLAFAVSILLRAAPSSHAALPPVRLATGDVRAEPVQLEVSVLLAWAAFPPMFLWCVLATRRAWIRDPARQRRRARRALGRLIRELRARPTAPTRAELETWRYEVRAFWQVAVAAPSGAEITVQSNAGWGKLWGETEHALFSRAGGLPADWVGRAAGLYQEAEHVKLPARLPRGARHWLPWATASLLFALADRAGAGEPRDWASRHNLASALAQEGKWDAAHAHWTAAFLLNPRHPAVRSGWRESLSQVGAADPTLRRLVEGAWYERAAGWGSSTEWARIAQGSTAGFVVAVCGWLALAYAGARRSFRLLAGGAAALAAAGAVAGTVAFGRYGALTHPQAACIVVQAAVRPVPSDAVPPDALTLRPGTVVVVDRSFLGWDHVLSAGGNVGGWLRRETSVWIYRERDDSQISRSYPKERAE